ncbi:hypothetical protein [Frankia sp. Cr1]|nr:hypothetical protein [Frankia sp. Cr1]
MRRRPEIIIIRLRIAIVTADVPSMSRILHEIAAGLAASWVDGVP